MTLLYFCKSCGDKCVRDVQPQLEELFQKKILEPNICGLCFDVIPSKENADPEQPSSNDITQSSLLISDDYIKSDVKGVSNVDTEETATKEETATTEETATMDVTHSVESECVELDRLQDESDEQTDGSDEGSNFSDEIEIDLNKGVSSKVRGELAQKKSFSKTSHPVNVSELDMRVQDMICKESVQSNSLSCKMCSKDFKRSARGIHSFVNHISCHTGEEPISKPYKCPECQFMFKNHWSLRNHMISHSKVNTQVCTFSACGFKTKGSLKKHIDSVHGGIKRSQKKRHICQICGHFLEYGQSLRKHLMRHQGLKPCKCEECGKCFLDNPSLVRHQQRHKEVKETICEICGKSFHTVADLKIHLVTHTDKRKYQCESCPYRAKRLGNLKAHVRNIHTESSRDKCRCRYCGLTFVSAGSCTKHEKKHQGGLELAEALLKPYQCQDCGYRATKPCEVRIHRRVHTGEKPYKCTYCKKVFSYNGQRNKHMNICKAR